MRTLKLILLRSVILALFISFALTVLLSGCYKVRFYHDTDMLREKHDKEISSNHIFFPYSQIVSPAKIGSACPSGASMVEIEQSIMDGLTHYFSLGIYNKQTVRVWCKRRNR